MRSSFKIPMVLFAGVALGGFSVGIGSCPALACDPNEECSRCLASASGHCITYGNDPVCEARKLACQREAGGPSHLESRGPSREGTH
jgi:hypothetical protein